MSEIPSPALIAALHMAIRYVEQVAATPQAAAARPLSPRAAIRDLKRIRAVLDEEVNQKVKPQHRLAVWYGSLPESNGKMNWTAILHRPGEFESGLTLDRSEYPDRVRYEADRARYLIGELQEEPDILAYDANLREPLPPGGS